MTPENEQERSSTDEFRYARSIHNDLVVKTAQFCTEDFLESKIVRHRMGQDCIVLHDWLRSSYFVLEIKEKIKMIFSDHYGDQACQHPIRRENKVAHHLRSY